MTAQPRVVPMPGSGSHAVRVLERNALVVRRTWWVLLSGFFEPVFYLLGLGFGLGAIVGDIEDEYDFEDVENNIVPEKGGQYRVKALTEIADFNQAFGTDYSDEEFDTIGGLILKRFGRVPKRGEQIAFDNLTFKVLRADSRRLHLLQVTKKATAKG